MLMSKKTTNGEARGRDIQDGKERKLAKFQPTQLSLFQTFLPEAGKYSNTIEFYDAIPKYFTNKRQMGAMREGPEGREIYLPVAAHIKKWPGPQTRPKWAHIRVQRTTSQAHIIVQLTHIIVQWPTNSRSGPHYCPMDILRESGLS